MIGRRTCLTLFLAPALALIVSGHAAASGTPRAAKKLVSELRERGRAEVGFTRVHHDMLRDEDVTLHGRLVLEPPHLAKLEFDETQERISLRDDGGEWLQPRLEQMLRFEPQRAWAALRWWRLFAGSEESEWTERRVGDDTYVVRMGLELGIADSARVRVGPDGLPLEIRIRETGDQPVVYSMGRWRFVPARGEKDFVLKAPKGYEVFDMP